MEIENKITKEMEEEITENNIKKLSYLILEFFESHKTLTKDEIISKVKENRFFITNQSITNIEQAIFDSQIAQKLTEPKFEHYNYYLHETNS